MSILAIIPARGGSQRVPRKNIKEFLGKPVMAYSIETALDSGLFDEVMVSTDDREIAAIAERYGATIPFMRSKHTADAHASTADVLIEVIEMYEHKNRSFDIGCCIYPTAPLLRVKTLRDSYQMFIENAFDTLFPVVQYSYPIQRALVMKENKVNMVWEEYYASRSQDLEPRYHDAGQFYWFKTGTVLQTRKMFTENSGAIVLNELFVQDIDSETDWKLAELKFRFLNDS